MIGNRFVSALTVSTAIGLLFILAGCAATMDRPGTAKGSDGRTTQQGPPPLFPTDSQK